MSSSSRQFVGSFAHLDCLMDAIKRAQAKGIEVKDLYSPVPVPEAIELISPGRSPVRFATFLGGISGLVGGLALAIGTAMVWDLIVFGKPVTHPVPFLVIGFEGAILFGGLATLTALLLFGGLPFFKGKQTPYRPEFSRDRFGLWVGCRTDQVEATQELLRDAGADDVHVIEEVTS